MDNFRKAELMAKYMLENEYQGDIAHFDREMGGLDQAVEQLFFWLEDGHCEDTVDIRQCVGYYFMLQ
jgi:hypothetical protein